LTGQRGQIGFIKISEKIPEASGDREHKAIGFIERGGGNGWRKIIIVLSRVGAK